MKNKKVILSIQVFCLIFIFASAVVTLSTSTMADAAAFLVYSGIASAFIIALIFRSIRSIQNK